MKTANYKKKNIVLCSNRPLDLSIFRKTWFCPDYEFYLISKKSSFTPKQIKKINPEFIFFLYWSWIVPDKVFNKYKCVVFHSASLPKFRGGSPIQNQIIRGQRRTKLTAFLMDKGIDTGDILLQEDLSLEGHIRDIFERINHLFPKMIKKIIKGNYSQKKQKGKGSFFRRRIPEQSELKANDFNKPLEYIYNFIRMLEDPYPNAFLKIGRKNIIFKEAEFDRPLKKLRVVAEISTEKRFR